MVQYQWRHFIYPQTFPYNITIYRAYEYVVAPADLP